ncbi:hypothetical protein RhoFasGS6_05158 [Rhodococcus fascians]|nr:hypothetical protein [Rhodococcus fascians]
MNWRLKQGWASKLLKSLKERCKVSWTSSKVSVRGLLYSKVLMRQFYLKLPSD